MKLSKINNEVSQVLARRRALSSFDQTSAGPITSQSGMLIKNLLGDQDSQVEFSVAPDRNIRTGFDFTPNTKLATSAAILEYFVWAGKRFDPGCVSVRTPRPALYAHQEKVLAELYNRPSKFFDWII